MLTKKQKWVLIAVLAITLCAIRVSLLPVGGGGKTASSLQKGYYDYEGVIHWHTSYSGDAWGTYEDVAKVANRQKVDFMVSTEHNNWRAYEDHKEGWYGTTMMLVGVEISRWQEGWLLGLNLRQYNNTYKDTTDKVLTDLRAQGGMVFIAHPNNPRWWWRAKIDPRMAGQEIMDLTDEWFTVPKFDFLTSLFYYPFNKTLAWLNLLHRLDTTLQSWDNITSKRSFVGIYAPDFHQNVKLGFGIFWHFPKVDDMLRIVHDHIVTPTPFTGKLAQDKATLYKALGKGHVYVAVDLLQDATGFFFSASQGKTTAWMGDTLPAGKDTAFNVRLPETGNLRNVVINLYRNGELIGQSTDKNYKIHASRPGAYRVEVDADMPTVFGFGRKIGWIYSNPVYLR